jgi:hypothetical protein
MKKISILFILLIGFGIEAFSQSYELRVGYYKLKEIESLLGNAKSVAFYAVKGSNKLSYAVYDINTSKVIYFDGKKIKDSEFRRIKQNLELDKEIKFNEDLLGATGIKRDVNFIFLKPMKILNFKKKSNSSFNRSLYEAVFTVEKKNFSPFYHTISYKVVNIKTRKPISGGSGPGETVVSKLP